MAAILTNGVLKTRTAPIFQPLLAPARYKGCGSTKARDVPPPMPRIVRPGGRQHRLELDAAPDGQAHSQPTDQPPSPLTHAGAASSQQLPQGSVSGREPTTHCASCDPPCASDLAAPSPNPQTPRNPPKLRPGPGTTFLLPVPLRVAPGKSARPAANIKLCKE